MSSYKELIVWKKSIEVTVEIYSITDQYPKSELYGLVSQMRRSAVSIPSNIAEGRYRGTLKDCKHFWEYAFASGAELETQIEISKKLQFTSVEKLVAVELKLTEVMKMLNVMIRKIKADKFLTPKS